MCGAIVTSPFDVVKTRLQSSTVPSTKSMVPRGAVASALEVVRNGDIYVHESPRALFKGLGPTLVGVVPARTATSISVPPPLAGVVTSTATNPIWVLVQGQAASGSRGSWACIKQILREEGVRGFYKGMTASYLGVTEGTIQWVLYEKLKKMSAAGEGEAGGWKEWAGMLGSAGTAKCVASLITYPHEVIRTRLRQPPPKDGPPKYTGLYRTLRVVIAEEGARSLYGGLSAHLMRVIPNSAVMYAIYEAALRVNF
ncbi:mitochondrial carrier [Coprinellus micaceus]|uniref:Mitochondrial carrier n=1 Tax=Coprinellus micaceus TaxID=71717 RepID=A0A4Y7SED6_COPMI|nr:mitochondrial carrier [Coprinellus micaceus]